MRLYDLVLVLKSSLTETQRKKLLDTVREWLKNIKVAKEEAWGQKALSYPIKKEISGFYHFMSLEGESFPQDFEKRLFGNDSILRHLVIRRK